MDSFGTRRPVIPLLVQDVNGDQITVLANTIGTSQDISNYSTVIGLLKSIVNKIAIINPVVTRMENYYGTVAAYVGTFTADDPVPQSAVGQTNIYIAEDNENYYFGIKATTGGVEQSPLSEVNFPSPILHYAVPFMNADPNYPPGLFSDFQVDLKTADGEIVASLCDNIGADHSINFTVLSKKLLTLQLQ